ncbi:MAG: YdcF family protein [Chthoniobacter sp.]|nr:YdcF family protein [Chthoniobacter sp.]
MRATGRERIYFDPDLVPPREVAVVLGTAPTIQGRSNLFFESRMNACAELWRRGKVRHFIVSGDNGRKTYDEPTAMRDALISRAVPASAITLDYAGFRTLDTMARAAAVFGQRKITVVTDDFHLPRALFLAEAHGLDAIGFGGKPVPVKYSRKTRTREVASRIAAWIDVNALHTKPRFFGPPVTVPVTAMSDK